MAYVGKLPPTSLLVGGAAGNKSDLTPKLFCYPSANFIDNVTGAGVTFTPICDNVAFDVGGGFNAGTGVYTAPEDGYYLVDATVTFKNVGASNGLSVVQLGTGVTIISISESNPAACRTASNLFTESFSIFLKLNQGQGVAWNVKVEGGTQTVGYYGDYFGLRTYLSIMKIA